MNNKTELHIKHREAYRCDLIHTAALTFDHAEPRSQCIQTDQRLCAEMWKCTMDGTMYLCIKLQAHELNVNDH